MAMRVDRTLLSDAQWERIASREKCRWRHRMENFLCWIKYFRHIATCYDQTESSCAAMIFAITALLALA